MISDNVVVEVHPHESPSASTREIAVTMKLKTTAPSASKEMLADGVRPGRTMRAAVSARQTVIAPNQYAALMPNSWAIPAVNGYPSPAPIAVETDRVAIAWRAAADGRSRRAVAMLTGSRPNPIPWSARPRTTMENVAPMPDRMHPARTATKVIVMRSRWRVPSANRPRRGVVSAPVSKAAVSTHWALERLTW